MNEKETNKKIIDQIEDEWGYMITGLAALNTLGVLLEDRVGEPIPEEAVPGLSYFMLLCLKVLFFCEDFLPVSAHRQRPQRTEIYCSLCDLCVLCGYLYLVAAGGRDMKMIEEKFDAGKNILEEVSSELGKAGP